MTFLEAIHEWKVSLIFSGSLKPHNKKWSAFSQRPRALRAYFFQTNKKKKVRKTRPLKHKHKKTF